MSINEAAHYLGVCPDTVRRHIRLGLLAARQQPRGTKYQWLVEVPNTARRDGDSDERRPPAAERKPPTVEEYERMQQLLNELQHMLHSATAELEARRNETAQLLSLLERARS